MALSKQAASASISSVYVNSATAGSGGTAYTVPDGKVFKGNLVSSDNDQKIDCLINGTEISVYVGSISYGRNPVIPCTFPPGTVFVNNSANYFLLTGELIDGS
jgi:hypothetical protein